MCPPRAAQSARLRVTEPPSVDYSRGVIAVALELRPTRRSHGEIPGRSHKDQMLAEDDNRMQSAALRPPDGNEVPAAVQDPHRRSLTERRNP